MHSIARSFDPHGFDKDPYTFRFNLTPTRDTIGARMYVFHAPKSSSDTNKGLAFWVQARDMAFH